MDNKRFTFNYLRNVEIEISSLCNRKCGYCPQSMINRKRELFPLDKFRGIIEELKEIRYAGGLAFHQFNEPLLEYDHLCKCIKIAKEVIPDIRLELYTNGDFIDKDKFKELKEMGINRLVITCQLNKDEKWTKELGKAKVKEVLNRLNIHKKIILNQNSAEMKESNYREFVYKLKEFGYSGVKNYPFKLQIRSVDYYNEGSTRMGYLNNNADRDRNPCTYYCYSLMHGIHVSYKGNVYMCCDCCEDVEGVERFRIGSVYDEPIYDLFAKKNQLMTSYLKGKNEICNVCFWNA